MRERTARDTQFGQRRQHIVALQLTRHGQRHALPARLVDDRQDAVSATIVGATLDEVIGPDVPGIFRSEEHTSELQSLMRISYAVFCLKKKKSETKKPAEQPINYKKN